MTEFLASHECDQGFTIEMFIGAMVAVVCCPREIESEDFCLLIVGQLNDEWLTKTDLRLSRMQINDVISEALLDNEFNILDQFDDPTSDSYLHKFKAWCQGFLITHQHINSLWQTDMRLLEGKMSQNQYSGLIDCMENTLTIINELSLSTSTDAFDESEVRKLNPLLAELHHYTLLFERLKIEHNID